jgi:hypothetical protein
MPTALKSCAGSAAKKKEKYVTLREYYAHRLQTRELLDQNGHPAGVDAQGQALRDDALSRWGRLFQEYCCMALAKTEMDRCAHSARRVWTVPAQARTD